MGWQLKIEFVMFLHGIVIVMVTKIIFFFYFLQILVKIFSRLLKTSDSDYDGIFLYLPRVTDDICLLTDDTICRFLTNDDTKKSRWSHSWLLVRSHAFPTYFVPESENHRDDQRVDDIFRMVSIFKPGVKVEALSSQGSLCSSPHNPQSRHLVDCEDRCVQPLNIWLYCNCLV